MSQGRYAADELPYHGDELGCDMMDRANERFADVGLQAETLDINIMEPELTEREEQISEQEKTEKELDDRLILAISERFEWQCSGVMAYTMDGSRKLYAEFACDGVCRFDV